MKVSDRFLEHWFAWEAAGFAVVTVIVFVAAGLAYGWLSGLGGAVVCLAVALLYMRGFRRMTPEERERYFFPWRYWSNWGE